MKRVNKIILWVLVSFFSLFILANIAISVFAKQIVVKQIEQNLKLPATLGSIRLAFPFSIDLNELTVGDLFKAKRLSVSPNLLGFFAGKIVLDRVALVNPVINLKQANDGSLNLPKLEQKGKQPPVYLLSLSIKNGEFIFTDKKISPLGYKVILGSIDVNISKVLLPVTSLKTNFKVSLDVLDSNNMKLGSAGLTGWVDFGPKDMDGILTVKDLDLTYFSPYYGNFISSKKLLSAKLNINSTFKSENNNLKILTDFKLANLVYAQEEESGLAELDLTKNALDFFTDSKGNLNLEFEVNTKLDNPSISVSELKKIILKTAAKNLSNQSPQDLITKVNDNIEQFKAIGKTLKSIFKGE
ncbi:MAG: DUF748 domain-containing protein [Candidatus Omnitrophica bacterium]|nr:DUF748 domain-containing protein [Candidatus Omnitrophota bacterium]